MKDELTISLEAEIILKARQYARAHGVSLSSLVEQALTEVMEQPDSAPSFSSRWRGKLQPSRRGGPRYDSLARKYL